MNCANKQPPDPVIELRDVCFAYGDQEALHNVSLRIAPHTFVAVVGPNGGGKTTLLRLILGELQPLYGTVRVFGVTPVEARSRIGYVPQSLHFDAQFPVTVHDVVLMGRVGEAHWGFYTVEDRHAVRSALHQVGLAALEHRPFSELSGGERQRVLIAQALAGGAELLLLDEPTANIDAEHAAQLYALFKDMTRERTIIMVSHNLSVVTANATHVICVNRLADCHPIAAVTDGTVATPYGANLLHLHHGSECHINDPSAALHAPHHLQPPRDGQS